MSTRDRLASHLGRQFTKSALIMNVDVQRASFYVSRLVTLPLLLIVLLSFSVFWMDRSSLGDRISVSFIGILTVVAYQVVMSETLPRIAYGNWMNVISAVISKRVNQQLKPYEKNAMNRKRVFLSPPRMGEDELRLVHEAFESNYIAPLGPQINAFEKEFSDLIGIHHCVALSSGTGAMHLVPRDIGVGPGDEIVASSLILNVEL